jgi:hypothetical protein
MIAELAIANAAFAVIKETVANGGDIMAAGQHLFSFFDNKAAMQKRRTQAALTQKRSLPLNRLSRTKKSCKK